MRRVGARDHLKIAEVDHADASLQRDSNVCRSDINVHFVDVHLRESSQRTKDKTIMAETRRYTVISKKLRR